MEKEIFVTKAYLPPRAEFDEYLDRIWDSAWLTNMGKLHEQLKEQLAVYLGVGGIELFVNGHLALEMCLQAFDFPKGSEVITTPFSFASTTHAIVRQGLKPVFADVRQGDCTLDPERIEELITDKTVAILPVHVYGNICDVKAIQEIADRHSLKVIYDAAHAFGETVDGQGVGTFGDASMFSFHATKVYNTIEGGAITWNTGAACKAAENDTSGQGSQDRLSYKPAEDGTRNQDLQDKLSYVSAEKPALGQGSQDNASWMPAEDDMSGKGLQHHAYCGHPQCIDSAADTDGSGVRLNITDKSEFAKKLYQLKNFGIIGQEQVGFVGGNAKMNEFQAAMGLCNLKHIEELIDARRGVYERYMKGLETVLRDNRCRCLLGDVYGNADGDAHSGVHSGAEGNIYSNVHIGAHSNTHSNTHGNAHSGAGGIAGSDTDASINGNNCVKRNFAYFPILFESEARRDEVFDKLAAKGIHARKYFYPCINDYDCYKDEYDSDKTPVARDLARRVLTLPIYHDLENEIVDEICRTITE